MTEVSKYLNGDGIAVIPTETVFGVVASACDKPAVEKLYALKRRNPAKPYIILVASFEDIESFGVTLDATDKEALSKYWPGPFSIILPCDDDRFAYLHRGMRSLAFRMPAKESLRHMLQMMGPLVAPSANPEGEATARLAAEARAYFGDAVDAYVEGNVRGQSSTIIRLVDGTVEILRP